MTMESAWIYFVRERNDGQSLIKIGLTTGNVLVRLKGIQYMSPVSLEVIGVIRVQKRHVRELESRLHERFSHLREYGEWFRPATELIEYIALHAHLVHAELYARFCEPPALEILPGNISETIDNLCLAAIQ
jgi:hypothetical protein